MPGKRPATIDEYIAAAPRTGQAHLRRLRAVLKGVAPQAEEAIKWGQPFFIEPRFLFAFSAHKAHVSFAPNPVALAVFATDLRDHETTTGLLKIPYASPLPEQLIRKLARFSVRELAKRTDDAFWYRPAS